MFLYMISPIQVQLTLKDHKDLKVFSLVNNSDSRQSSLQRLTKSLGIKKFETNEEIKSLIS